MTHDPAPFDWHNPIPGNPHAIQGEIDRVRALRDYCSAGEQWLRQLTLHTWQGAAADQFESFRSRLVTQWAAAENEYDRWSRALMEYRQVLVGTRALAQNAIAEATQYGDWAQARSRIDELRIQHRAAADTAVTVLNEVAAALLALPQPFGPTTPDSQPAQRRPRPPAERAIQAPTDEPLPVEQSPADLHRKTKSLCDAVLEAHFVRAETL